MRLTLVEAPFAEPLTAEEVKSRLNIGAELSDANAEAFISAARMTIDGQDGWLGRALVTQTWRGSLAEFPCRDGGRIDIPLPPLQEVLSIAYIDGDGASVELPANKYQVVEGARAYVVPAYGESWPATRCQPDAVSVEFVCGYGDPDQVPEPIRAAIALMVSNLRTMSARDLSLASDRVDGVGEKTFVVSGNASAALDNAVKWLLQSLWVPR